MLSIYTLKSASEASNYYQQGDYSTYLGASERSEWFGKGAELLDLKGPVDHAVFKKLLEGELPNGKMMNQTKNGNHHRPGYDLTFSAPKSVSILGLVAGNEAVLDAFREAVRETLRAMEQKYAATRKKDQGVESLQKTKNWTFALFEHVDSREGDPAFHIHAVLLNLTLTEQQEWRTIFGDYLYRDKMLNGLQSRAFFAPKLLNMGHELDFKPQGLFEIKGLEPLIEPFSKRSKAILADLEKRGESGGLAASRANLRTRTSKKKHYPLRRKARWIKEAKEHGFSLKQLKNFAKEAKARGPIPLPDPEVDARIALDAAIAHLSEFLPSFSVPKLIKTAGQISLYPHNQANFIKIIEAKMEDKSLLYRGQQLVSAQRLQLEETVKAHIDKAKPVLALVSSWFRKWTATRVCDGSFEVQGLVALLGNTHQQLLLKAESGQGLKNLIKGYCQIAQFQRAYPRILCQRTQDVESLKSQMPNQPIHSIEGFLHSCAPRMAAQKPIHPLLKGMQYDRAQAALDIWIVLGDMTLGQVQRLQEASLILGARLIFATARPKHTHAFLEELKMPLINIVCKENTPLPEALIKALHQCESQSKITEIADPSDRLFDAIQFITTQETLAPLVVLNAFEATKANQGIRAARLEQGRITGPVLETTILKALPLSAVQKSQVHAYQIGDWLYFERGLEKNTPTYWRVEATCLETDLLKLSAQQNVLWELKPSDNPRAFSVFREETRVLQAGDEIKWTRSLKHFEGKKSFGYRSKNHKSLDRIKDQTARVLAVDSVSQRATVILKNGVEIPLDFKSEADQHWDYGYAVPLYQAPSDLGQSVLLLDHQKLDERDITHLHQALNEGRLPCAKIFCSNLSALKDRILQGLKAPSFTQTPYDRAEALAKDQTINTHLLFPGLEKAYLEAKGSNPALKQPSKQEAPDLELRLSAEAVDRACVGTFEREAVLSKELLKAKAAFLAGPRVSFDDLDRAFDRALKEGWLRCVGKNADGEDMLSARHILLIEKRCRREIIETQDQVKPLFDKNSATIQAVRGDPTLTQGQKEAVELILTTPHRLVAVQGIAGSGKTTALSCIRENAEKIGFKPFVLANVSAAKEKAKDSSGGMQAMTTAQFLSQSTRALRANPMKARLDYSHRLLILDEASLTSTDAFFELMAVVRELGTRLTVMGDFKQQGSIRWGILLHDLIAYGLKTVVMRENVRLKNRDAFKTMQRSYAGDIAGALKSLGSRLKEIPDKEEALQFMVQSCQASALAKDRTWLIVPGNEDRRKVNEGIRNYLINQEQLQGASLQTEILVPVDRLEVEKQYLSAYTPLDILLFNRSPHRAIQTGEYLHIDRIENHRLVLRSEAGRIAYWSPKDLHNPQDVEIYRVETRDFCVAERVVFSRNQENLGLINGEFGTILGMEGTKLRLELKDRCVTLDLSQRSAQHFDYSYALTTYKIQGQEGPIMCYGETPRPYERFARHLRVGDEVSLAKGDSHEALSKLTIVQESVQGSMLHLVSEKSSTTWSLENTPALFEVQKGSYGLIFVDAQKEFCRVLPKNPPKNFKLQAFFERNLEKGSVFCRSEEDRALIKWCKANGCVLQPEVKLRLMDQNQKVSTVFTPSDAQWSYYPPFPQRKPYEIPASSTQQALTVLSSRGDDMTMVTAHARYFQKCVELQAFPKRSAASFHDPHWEALHKKVDLLVANIESQPLKQAALKVELDALAVIQKRDAAWRTDEQRPDYDKQAWAKCDVILDTLLKPKDPSASTAPSSPSTAEGISSLITAMREALKESQMYRAEETRTRLQSLNQNLPSPSANNHKTLEAAPHKESQAGTNLMPTKKQDLERER
ncbi:MAG: conjugative relaxase [Gammaproteobacteria bacterium]|nr:conjugative relaxase [Gammaproteobacteria bacterium]